MKFDRYLHFENHLDISKWEEIGLELKGTRNKILVREPKSGQIYLFKTPKQEHEIFNEVFNSLLCNALRIKHVDYYNAARNGIKGVLCKSFLNSLADEELWEMRELITRHSKSIDVKSKLLGRDKSVLVEHNIENIFMILKEEFGDVMLNKFFQMVGFDALIGHTDRHWENYGFIIFSKDGSLHFRFSPIYDTVSSYAYSSLEKDHILELVDKSSHNEFYQYKSDKLSKISIPNGVIKMNHFDLIKHIRDDLNMRKYIPLVFKPFREYSRDVGKGIFSRYFKGLDGNHKRLVLQILANRQKIGLDLLK